MSNEKKDLTRIEDLGEFIHELNSTSDFTETDDYSSEVPELPLPEESETSFETELDFSTSEDLSSTVESDDLTTLDVSMDFEEGQSSENPVNFEDETNIQEEPFPEEKKEEFSTSDWGLDQSQFDEKIESSPEIPVEPIVKNEREYKTPETFEDLKKFSESSSFNVGPSEGNPSFSLLIKNVRFIEDVDDIISLLNDFKLIVDSEEQTKARLMRGMLLVPRISEYTAIFLAHKLRRFDIDIEVGLSDEIHPPKHQEKPETGIVSKHSLYQNQTHHFNFENPKLDISEIILSASPTLDGHQVVRYLGVASEHKIVGGNVVEDESSEEVILLYQELAQKLKAHALKANSNAVVGLNYQLTPLPSDFGAGGHKYRLSCTGNLVWVNKL